MSFILPISSVHVCVCNSFQLNIFIKCRQDWLTQKIMLLIKCILQNESVSKPPYMDLCLEDKRENLRYTSVTDHKGVTSSGAMRKLSRRARSCLRSQWSSQAWRPCQGAGSGPGEQVRIWLFHLLVVWF